MNLPPPLTVEQNGDRSGRRSLYRYVWRMSGWHQIALSAIALVIAALSMAPLELQKRIVNDAVGQSNLNLLLVLGGIYAGVVVLQALAKFALRVYQGWVSESSIKNSRHVLARIDESRRAPATGDANEGQGKAVSVIGTEVEQLGGFVGEAVSDPLVNAGNLVAIFGYMIVIEPKLAAASLIFLIPQLVAVPLIQRLVNRLVQKRVVLLRGLNELIAGSDWHAEDERQASDESGSIAQIYRNRLRIYLLKFASKSIVNFFNGAAPIAALVVGGWFVIQGQTTIGVVVAFISGFERIADPVRQLIAFYGMANQARVRHKMIVRWM